MVEEYIYKKVDKIIFGLMSPKMIKKRACAKVVTAELYDKEGYPVDGGLMDIRLGVIDPGLRCKTCSGKIKECTGHFGYIELARPIIHVKYIDIIITTLRCFCSECNKLLIIEDKLKDYQKKPKPLIKYLRTVKQCPHCKSKQPIYKIEKPTSVLENDKRIDPIKMRARIEKVSDDELKWIGLNSDYARPEWMILTNLPIPPVTMRPSITLESGERSEDDLTHKIGDIVRINQRLFENINAGAPEIIIEDLWDLLQYHITTYFDNELPQVPPARHRSSQILKTLSERIKSKEGRFRHNLAGKRVNFSARSVISPDPMIKFDEVGIPTSVAMELTVPERVNEWNIEYLKKFIKNGSIKYPGANYVIMPDGKKKKITEDTKEQILEELQIGFIVERHLIEGDISVFNRQPSLHRMSIMCHKIKVLPGKSFRLNPGVCAPYNADFDGDEMNLHIPQNEEAQGEAEILMKVQTQIVSPKNGLNVIGCIQDAITGNYILTKELNFDREEAIDILYSIGVDEFSGLKGNEISGKDIFSVLLPKDFDFIGISKEKEQVIIKKGKLIKGVIDKATIGEENGTLLRSIFAKYGNEQGIKILNMVFKLGLEILLRKGFTTSIADTDLPQDILNKNKEKIVYTETKINELIDDYKKGKLEPLPGLAMEQTLEAMIIKLLSQLRDRIGENVLESVSKKNPTILMAVSGGAGGFLNMAQMSATVGQQSIGGVRIKDGYKNRTLTIFEKGSLIPEARGFIKKGYKQGLKPGDFFFHAITGRDALMDLALRTPKSGYLYRRLSNALQDLRVEYDNTVRDADGRIVQFKYGDDEVDVSKSEGGIINVKRIVKEVIEDVK